MITQALIPAAGRGSRLDRPGTPKPLVDVYGQALVLRLINQLQEIGVDRIVLVVGFEGEKVATAVSRHPSVRAELDIVWNPRWECGLAASLLCAADRFEGDFLIAMADHVFDSNLLKQMIEAPVLPGYVNALVDRRVGDIFSLSSAVKMQMEGTQVVAVGRALSSFNAVDAGCFVATPVLFKVLAAVMEHAQEADLSDGVDHLARCGLVTAVPIVAGNWDDVDTPADLIHAEKRLREEKRKNQVNDLPAPHATRPSGESYCFTAGAPVETQILLQRGLIKAPHEYNLIPDNAASSPIFVFTDTTVDGLYGQQFRLKLAQRGYDIQSVVLPDGEESKSLANYLYLVERVLARGVDERSVFISLGGGVVCNVCGFVASTIYRGLRLIHLPTTLMAQCDAAISHKQAINGHQGKNMVGSYYSPLLVGVDPEVLATLPPRLKGDGLAEGIKHALGQDPGYVDFLLSYDGEVAGIDFMEAVVRRNVALKCDLAKNDPKELRDAMVLQYGHTVGHPIEHLTGYRFYHGESVAVGMVVAARVSRLLGACGDDLVELHIALCAKYSLPYEIPRSIRAQDILDALRHNKRFLIEGTRMALLQDVGKLWSVEGDYAIPVSDQVLAEAISQTMEGPQ